MRHITSCLVVLALGLAMVQAAPKKIEKKSISDAAAPKAIENVHQNLDAPAKLGDEALLEDADGQKVDRKKKQASTTFCVEIRQNKPTQVDCSELNNNQPLQPLPQPQSEPEQQPQPTPPEIKIDITQPTAPMGPPCEPEIAGFIAPGGDVVYAPTGNCAHNIPNTFQLPYSGANPMMPSGPGGHLHVLHIPGGFPHSGFPGNYPSQGLPGSYPAGMVPNSGAGPNGPSIHISSGPGGPGGFPMNGLPNGGLPNNGAGVPTIHISSGPGGPGGFPMNGLPNGGLPNGGLPNGVPSINLIPGGGHPHGSPYGGLPHGGSGVPTINIVPGNGLPGGMPSGGLPNGGAGLPTINILPGNGLPGGLPNGGYPSGGYPSGGSPIHVLHLPGGGLPSGPPAGGNGPTIYITPGSGTPGVSPVGPHLPGHLHGHHHGPHLKGVECTCKSNLGTNLFRSADGMPSNEQLAAQFLDDLQKNAQQQQPGSPMMSMAPRSEWSVSSGGSMAPRSDWSLSSGGSIPRSDWSVSSGGSMAPRSEWSVSNGGSMAPRSDWSLANGVSISSGQPDGKSAGTDPRYMPVRPMSNTQSQIMYQQQSAQTMTPGLHGMHGMPMSGYGMTPMMGPMGMPMRSNGQYDDSFQSGYPMQGLRFSRGPDDADAKAVEQEESPKPETEEEAKKSSNNDTKKSQDGEIESKNTRFARFLMGEKDDKSNMLDDE